MVLRYFLNLKLNLNQNLKYLVTLQPKNPVPKQTKISTFALAKHFVP
ncbi:hypothetical protein JCM19296_3322 [Nonlabens ulvanivorans]|uniref:Uncharacterized protein n=1 Tax=Nonlabens ulvanivorans TaxID=906888 RepID=A0A081DFL7_NONUL|nr:hypothetical protein JCM19296_3322 [Nonlabens ulvanivorans]